MSGISLQQHVNKRNPISFFVLPFLDGVGLKSQFRVKQQAGNILIETRHGYFGGLMFGERKVNHPLDEVPAHATPTGGRRNNDVPDGTTAARFPAIEVGEPGNFTPMLDNCRIGTLKDRLPQLRWGQRVCGLREQKKQFLFALWKSADYRNVCFFCRAVCQWHYPKNGD